MDVIGDPAGQRHVGWHSGVMVAGVPVGDPGYIRHHLADIAGGIVSYIQTTVERLRDHPHALWACLARCCASRFDYWLRHVEPGYTVVHAVAIDGALARAAESLGYEGMLHDDITLRRFNLPARYRGCGIECRYDLAPRAFVACFVESMIAAVGQQVAAGGAAAGAAAVVTPDCALFPGLIPWFGLGAFSPGGHRFARFLQPLPARGGLTSLQDSFRGAWGTLALTVANAAGAAPPVPGPLVHPASMAGQDFAPRRLQRAISEQLDRIRRDYLDQDILQLPRTDTAHPSTPRLRTFINGVGVCTS